MNFSKSVKLKAYCERMINFNKSLARILQLTTRNRQLTTDIILILATYVLILNQQLLIGSL